MPTISFPVGPGGGGTGDPCTVRSTRTNEQKQIKQKKSISVKCQPSPFQSGLEEEGGGIPVRLGPSQQLWTCPLWTCPRDQGKYIGLTNTPFIPMKMKCVPLMDMFEYNIFHFSCDYICRPRRTNPVWLFQWLWYRKNIMFSQACDKNSVQGGSGRPPLDRLGRQTPPGQTRPTLALPADSTHPTGMHSCFKNFWFQLW